MRLGIATTLTAIALTSCSATTSDEPEEDREDGIMAEIMCEEFVKDRLKAPATAEFSNQRAESIGDQRWDVTGTVDSENSFGALIRSNYRCDIRYVGDDKWRAKTVKVSD